jgi:hypothetical protein
MTTQVVTVTRKTSRCVQLTHSVTRTDKYGNNYDQDEEKKIPFDHSLFSLGTDKLIDAKTLTTKKLTSGYLQQTYPETAFVVCNRWKAVYNDQEIAEYGRDVSALFSSMPSFIKLNKHLVASPPMEETSPRSLREFSRPAVSKYAISLYLVDVEAGQVEKFYLSTIESIIVNAKSKNKLYTFVEKTRLYTHLVVGKYDIHIPHVVYASYLDVLNTIDLGSNTIINDGTDSFTNERGAFSLETGYNICESNTSSKSLKGEISKYGIIIPVLLKEITNVKELISFDCAFDGLIIKSTGKIDYNKIGNTYHYIEARTEMHMDPYVNDIDSTTDIGVVTDDVTVDVDDFETPEELMLNLYRKSRDKPVGKLFTIEDLNVTSMATVPVQVNYEFVGDLLVFGYIEPTKIHRSCQTRQV